MPSLPECQLSPASSAVTSSRGSGDKGLHGPFAHPLFPLHLNALDMQLPLPLVAASSINQDSPVSPGVKDVGAVSLPDHVQRKRVALR